MADCNEGEDLAELDVPLNRTDFFNNVIRSLSGTLEDTIGLGDAEAFITTVGTQIGREIGASYAAALGGRDHETATIARILVDLKARIGGAFSVAEINGDEIVFVNSVCPFGRNVEGRPSLCMMTTTVFGRIAADANGFAQVTIDEALATGHTRCRVRVALRPKDGVDGHKFFR